jgi:hypothetical protein
MTPWAYVGNATAERRERLEYPRPYPELLTALKTSPVACFHQEPKQRDDSYVRADFCLDIGSELFDAFFNTSTGYRGAYFIEADSGLVANRQLIAELSPMLVEWAIVRYPQLDRAWLIESLSLPTAKAWLGEDPKALCTSCAGGWSTSYVSDLWILNGRWENSTHTHATWGRQAPESSRLRIFGGFVNDLHEEWVDDSKRERAQHIWEHGWS